MARASTPAWSVDVHRHRARAALRPRRAFRPSGIVGGGRGLSRRPARAGAGRPIAPGPASARAFANARVYARDLDAVAGLAALRAGGIEVRTQAERIATVQALDRTLSFLFRVLAAIGGGGCALALGGALWVNAERKRRASAMLRLFGFGRLSVAGLPVLQALAVAGRAAACLGPVHGRRQRIRRRARGKSRRRLCQPARFATADRLRLHAAGSGPVRRRRGMALGEDQTGGGIA